jgi:hypothetical protein
VQNFHNSQEHIPFVAPRDCRSCSADGLYPLVLKRAAVSICVRVSLTELNLLLHPDLRRPAQTCVLALFVKPARLSWGCSLCNNCFQNNELQPQCHSRFGQLAETCLLCPLQQSHLCQLLNISLVCFSVHASLARMLHFPVDEMQNRIPLPLRL